MATAPLINYREMHGADLAVEILAIIEANKERWHQSAWRIELDGHPIEGYVDDPLNPTCTTAFCFAGWVAAVDGVKWAEGDRTEKVGDPRLCDCKTKYCENEHHQVHVSGYASARLEMEGDDEELFNGENSLQQLRDGVNAMVTGDSVVFAIKGYDEDEDEDYYDDDDNDDDEEDE